MTDDEIKVLEEMRDDIADTGFNYDRSPRFTDALTAAIDYIRDTSEMLEAAKEAMFSYDIDILVKFKSGKWGWSQSVEWYDSALSAWLSAWRETQEKTNDKE